MISSDPEKKVSSCSETMTDVVLVCSVLPGKDNLQDICVFMTVHYILMSYG